VHARERRVNRYYDPATDQFLSVDPDVAETGEPYAFTGDDPLNATDPLGLSGNPTLVMCSGGLKAPKGMTVAQACAADRKHDSRLQMSICKGSHECESAHCGGFLGVDCWYPLLPLAALACAAGGCEAAGASLVVAGISEGASDICAAYCTTLAKVAASEVAAQAAHTIIQREEQNDYDPTTRNLYQVSNDLINVLDGMDFADTVTEGH